MFEYELVYSERMENVMKIVGVAACPIGIAHTYMAAENIEKVCKARGFDVKMETQGSIGMENELEASEIEAADLVILAISVEIEERDRFDDKIVYEADVAKCVSNPDHILDEALKYYEERR